ncbi:MAG: HU family DNA-binding protein [Desulfobacterota bacterium]|nr:HU family DNA-binding protein [Thermodesulfobacteriota bacterium]
MAAKPMTKAQLIATIADALGTTKKVVSDFFETMSLIAYRETKKTGQFVVPGFGKLVKAQRKARTGRNPATGEPIKIKAKTVVKFRVAKACKDAVLS